MVSTRKSWMLGILVAIVASLGAGCAADADDDESDELGETEDPLRNASCRDGNVGLTLTWKAASRELVMDFDMSKFRANDPAQRSLYHSNSLRARLVHMTGSREDGYVRYGFTDSNANPRLGAKLDARGHVVIRAPLTMATWGKESMLSPSERPGSELPGWIHQARQGDKLEVEFGWAPRAGSSPCKVTLAY